MTDPRLAALCADHGIATHYRDFWQREYDVPEASLRALLRAMGVEPDAPDAAGVAPAGAAARTASPEAMAAAANARPAVLRTTDAAPAISVVLPPHAAGRALRWTLTLESGERFSGECHAAGDGAASLASASLDALPAGYHWLAVGPARSSDEDTDDASATPRPFAERALIVCPPRCLTVQDVAPGARLFGPTVQLYALRSRRNWGIGDFTDLAVLARLAARQGAGFVGLNPLHELFVDRPAIASPYSPSSRLSVNPLYLDVEAVEDLAECADAMAQVTAPAFQARLAALRDTPLVDYDGVAQAKLPLLRRLFEHFCEHHLRGSTARGDAFRAYVDALAALVLPAARFDALQAAMHAGDANVWGWPAWPARYREHDGEAASQFARNHATDVDFHLYLQWQADLQLRHAQRAARAAGMPIGLYRDLAVGANPGGADTWREPSRYALGVHVGAPPDEFNPGGQDWGLPPWIPARLALHGYAPWVRLLRANMRHAGGLRIDHVMGLMRLFWIPAGATPTEGTYVHYPLDELLAILALESERNGCIVVGEDLGTVPDEVRAALRRDGVHSCRVLYFERTHDGGFLPPRDFPAQALVTVTTHDLPTLQGFWQASDLAARDALDLFPSPRMREQQYAERTAARPRLLRALADAGLAPQPVHEPATLDAVHVLAVHRYLARTPAALMTLQLEDVFGETAQVNLPATTDAQYPNWRRKVGVNLEDFEADGRFGGVCAAIRAEGRGSAPAHDRADVAGRAPSSGAAGTA